MKVKYLIYKYQKLPLHFKASLWFLLCSFLQKGILIITTPIFTRLLTAEEYGQYNVFNSWLMILTVFVSLNLYSGVYSQGLVKFDKEKKEYASSLQGLCLTLVLCWTVIYLLSYNFWNSVFSLTTVQMLLMLVIIWVTSVFQFWAVEQRVDVKYRALVAVTLLASIAKPTISIIFVLCANDKVTARILGLALVEVICYSGFFFIQIRNGKKFYSYKFWKYALAFNLPLIPHYLSQSVLNNADRIMIDYLVGAKASGLYSLAYSISMIMTLFNNALVQTMEPWLYKKIKSNQTADIAKVAYPLFLLVAGLNLILIAFAPEIIAIFAPGEYYDAALVIPPVAMSVYFIFAYLFFAVFEFYYEKTNYIAVSTLTGAILNIILNYIFIKLFGYRAAGYTTLFCYIVYAVFHYFFMRKLCRERLDGVKVYDTKILLTISISFILIGFLFLAVYPYIIIRYLLVLIMATIILVMRTVIIEKIRNIIYIKQGKEVE